MSTEKEQIPKKERFILLRIVVTLFFIGFVKNLVDIAIDEYHFEWILWVKYSGLIIACAALFLGYRWGLFLFISIVAFISIAFAIFDSEFNPIVVIFGLIGPLILSVCVIPKWKHLRGWPKPKVR